MQAAQPYLSPAAAKQVLRYVCDENTVVVGGQAVMLSTNCYGLLANLRRLPAKRHTAGVEQARQALRTRLPQNITTESVAGLRF